MSISYIPSSGGLKIRKIETDPDIIYAWMYSTKVGIPRRGAGGFIYNDKLYIVGGMTDRGITTTVEIIDLITWSRSYGEYMPEGRAHFGYIFDGSKFYVMGGIDDGGVPRKEIYSYDPESNNWNKESVELSKGIAYTATAIVGMYIYLIGGLDENGDIIGDTYLIDIAGGTVTQKSSMNHPRQNHACAELNGKVYCFGGDDGSQPMNNVEMYDPDADTWTDLGDIMPEALSGIVAVKYKNKIIIVGG